MPVAKGTVENKPVTVLRDTGCSSVVVRRSLVPDNKLTVQEALCILIDGTIRRTPVAKIFVDMPYYTGPTTAVCMTNPIYDLIVGNFKGATEPNPSPHLTGAMNVIILDRPDSADNGKNQMTAAAMPKEERINQEPELEPLDPLQKKTVEEAKGNPNEFACNDARERTHLKLCEPASHQSCDYQISYGHMDTHLTSCCSIHLDRCCHSAGRGAPDCQSPVSVPSPGKVPEWTTYGMSAESLTLQPYRFCCVPSADETTLERTVSVRIRWMMNLLSESSPSLYDRDLDERPCFRLEGAIVTVGSLVPRFR